MRTALAILAAIAVGLFGLTAGSIAGFFGLFWFCKMVVVLTHNEDYMVLMWAGFIVIPVGALFGCLAFELGLVACAGFWASRREPRSFEVVSRSESFDDVQS